MTDTSDNDMDRPVRVRMYRLGLGDCFLLTFPRPEHSSDFHVLIDCGVLQAGEDAEQTTLAAVEDILKTTGGLLNLVIATHEHWDHLSGFIQARELFDQFHIDEVWLAWTEDPNNATAQALQRSRAARLAALQSALMKMTGEEFSDVRESIENVLGFFGGASGAQSGDEHTPRAAIQYLVSRKDANIHYCYPSKEKAHSLNGVKDARVYVFGPPEDLSLLRMSDPTQSGHQTYGVAALTAEDSFFASVMSVDGSSTAGAGPVIDSPYSQIQSLCYPFDNLYRVSPLEARKDPFFIEHYGFGEQAPGAWRRVDSDWLSVTSELALSLDNDTNNTSLVLAFELGQPGSGKVLLFAADAQVGNWLSWSKLSWPEPGGNGRITPEELLGRTVLYKVGHHGSHNATLRQIDPRHPGGLELMTSDDLVAMIPVHKDTAKAKGWNIPFPDLYTRLLQKTRGRVLRVDHGLPERGEAHSLTETQWNAFLSAVKETELYIEYNIGF